MARARQQSVKVEGLDQLEADLKRAAAELPDDIKKANQGLSRDVAKTARARAKGLGSTAAHAAGGIGAAGGSSAAAVMLKASSVPEILGAEFGGRRRPTTQQFQPWRGSGESAGYFLYPTIRELVTDKELEKRYGPVIDAALSGRRIPTPS